MTVEAAVARVCRGSLLAVVVGGEGRSDLLQQGEPGLVAACRSGLSLSLQLQDGDWRPGEGGRTVALRRSFSLPLGQDEGRKPPTCLAPAPPRDGVAHAPLESEMHPFHRLLPGFRTKGKGEAFPG